MQIVKTFRASMTKWITLHVFFAFILLFIFIFPISHFLIQRSTTNEINQIADEYILHFAEKFSNSVKSEDFSFISNYPSSYTNNPYINKVQLISSAGEIVYELDRKLGGKKYTRTHEYENHDTILSYTLSIEITSQFLEQRNAHVYRTTFIILISNLILSTLAVGLITKFYIAKPLKNTINELNNYNDATSPKPKTAFLELDSFIHSFLDLYNTKQEETRDRELSEQKYKDIFDHASIGMFHSNEKGKFISMNDSLAKLLGYKSADEALKIINNIENDIYVNKNDRSRVLKEAYDNGGHIVTEVGFTRVDSEPWIARLNFRIYTDLQTNMPIYEGFIEDISKEKQAEIALRKYQENLEELVSKRTSELSHQNHLLQKEIWERMQTEKALRESETKYRILAENVNDVIWTMTPDMQFTYVSPSVEKYFGYTPNEFREFSIYDVFTEESAELAIQRIKNNLEEFTKDPYSERNVSYEYQVRAKDGKVVWSEISTSYLIDEDKNIFGLLGVARDISERKIFTQKLERLAETDPLTSLYNRRYFYEIGAKEFTLSKHENTPLAIIMLDLDLFKNVNDTYGHQTGDLALQNVTKIINKSIRKSDIPARYGGEEFIILLPNTRFSEAYKTAERLRINVKDNPIYHQGKAIHFSISAGISCTTEDEFKGIDELVNSADAALYEAKRKGRNQVIKHTAALKF